MMEFDEVYHAHVQSVYRFAMRCVSNRELAEDLTAEAFLALYQHWEEIERARLPAWLLTVVRNRARDHWRRQEVERRHAEGLARPEPGHVPEAGFLDCPGLKPAHRVCLTLRYVHGMTRAEIASTTGLSEMQVKGFLQYALELLRKNSGRHEVS